MGVGGVGGVGEVRKICQDKTIKIWSLETFSSTKTLYGHTSALAENTDWHFSKGLRGM